LGIGEHVLLAVAPREAARDRVVQREVEARDGLAADRQRAQQRLEHLCARRIAIAVLGGVEDFIAEDADGMGELGGGHVTTPWCRGCPTAGRGRRWWRTGARGRRACARPWRRRRAARRSPPGPRAGGR